MMKSKLKPLAIIVGAIVSYQTLAYAQKAVTTRQQLWSIDVPNAPQTIAIDNRLLISARTDREGADKLRSVDPATGKPQWMSQDPIDDVIGVEKDTIYGRYFGAASLSDAPKQLVAIDSNTGQTRSRLNLDNSTFAQSLGIYDGAFIIASFIKNDILIEGNEISARTPTKTLWTYRTAKNSDLAAGSAVNNGVVFIRSIVDPMSDRKRSEFIALDAKTGKVMWTRQIKTAAFKPVETLIINNRVYTSLYSEDRFGKKAGWVKAFDLQTGKELWTHEILGGMALLANDREVFIIDREAKSKSRLLVVDGRTGKKLRQLDLPLKYIQGILLDNNVIYAIDVKIENVVPGLAPAAENHSWVNAFDASDGKLLWRTPIVRNSQIRSLEIQGDRLFLSIQGLKNEIKSTVRSFPTR